MALQKPILGRGLNHGHPLARGLVASWTMNEGAGRKISDPLDRRLTGLLVADTRWDRGLWGPCLRFDGTGDYVNIEGLPKFDGHEFTVSLWLKTATVAAGTRYAFGMGAGAGNGLLTVYNSTASLYAVNDFGMSLGVTGLTVGVWCHLVVTLSYSGDKAKSYSDGKWRSTDTSLTEPTQAATIIHLGTTTTLGTMWNGSLDHVQIWNRVLSEAEIRWLYENPFVMYSRFRVPPPYAPTVLTTWKEAEGTVTSQSTLAGGAVQTHAAQALLTSQAAVTGNAQMKFVWAEGSATMSAASSVTGNLILAATVPNATGNYDFAADPHCISLYDGETWATYLQDQKDSNDLECYPQVNTADFKEGDGSIEFDNQTRPSGIDWADADLPAGFPGKAGTGSQTMSVVFWMKLNSSPTSIWTPVGKGRAESQGWQIHLYASRIWLDVGDVLVTDWRGTTTTLTTLRWYHVGITFNGADRSYRIRVYDAATASNWPDTTGTMPHDLDLGGADFSIGYGMTRSIAVLQQQFDGRLDDLAVFQDVLTPAEIDSCRAGTYNYGGDGDCVTHWSFDSATFLTEDLNSTPIHEISVPTPDWTIYKTGTASLRFYGTENEGAYRRDADLSADFPYKAATTNLDCGIAFWFRADNLTGRAGLVTKYVNNTQGSIGVELNVISGAYYVTLQVRYGANTAEAYYHTTAINEDTWYHVVVNVSATLNTYSINVWDDAAQAEVTVAGALLHDPIVSSVPWKLGAVQLSTSPVSLDGWLDEIAFFDTPIVVADLIRAEGVGWAQSSISGSLSGSFTIDGVLTAQSSITLTGLQVKQHYVPAQLIEEPYPVPMLWDYENIAPDFAEAMRQWAPRMSQYTEEHLRRIMRELLRLGEQKETGWVDVN